jgi:hypothetical protein
MNDLSRHPSAHWGLHCCIFDRDCRRHAGWVWRLQISTPWWHLGVALRREDQFLQLDAEDWNVVRRRWTTCDRWPR